MGQELRNGHITDVHGLKGLHECLKRVVGSQGENAERGAGMKAL